MNIGTIFTKVLMALTGLFWLGFVIMHLSGNFLLFSGPEVFNEYPVLLRKTGVLLYIAEAALIFLLVGHIVSALRISSKNRAARNQGYAVKTRMGEATTASRTMLVGGIILLVFLVTHVNMFKFGDWGENGDLWGLVMRTFSDPLMVAWYVLAMLALGLHLSHGFGSAFQTLGLFKPSWRRNLRTLGSTFGWLIAAGFISMPIWAFLNQGS